jgi:hypothetical protein
MRKRIQTESKKIYTGASILYSPRISIRCMSNKIYDFERKFNNKEECNINVKMEDFS